MNPLRCLQRPYQCHRTTILGLAAPKHFTHRRTYMDTRRIAAVTRSQETDRLAEFTRDEQIDTSMVQVKSDENGLGEPQPLRRILQQINRETHCVVQLSKPGERNSAVVQIRAKMDLLKQLRDKEHQQKQAELAKREKKPKQIELNWAISENDLNLKLKQMEGFLDKGKQVEILLAAKKRQRRATPEEAENVLRKIKQTILDLGAKETKPMDGHLLKQATLTVRK